MTWEAATSNDYRIEASVNGQDWTVLARVQKTSGELRNVVDVGRSEARYVRVAGLPATQYGLSIFEFEVYGGYTLRCHATPFRVAPNSTAVATGTISPRDPDDEVGVESLDENVVSIAGTPRVDADGRIDVDLTTGSSGRLHSSSPTPRATSTSCAP